MTSTAPLPTVEEMQQAMVRAHGAAYADFPAQPEPAPASNEPVYQFAGKVAGKLLEGGRVMGKLWQRRGLRQVKPWGIGPVL